MFNTKNEAIADFAKYAIPMTDVTNKEHAAVLRKKDGKYYYTRIERGFHATVWPTALKYAVLKGEKYFLHTHPNYGYLDKKGRVKDNNPFSGVPGSRKLSDAGDATVVDLLKYDGIYLVSAMGNVYLYEGVGEPKEENNTYANSKRELHDLKPVMTGLNTSKFCYKPVKNSRYKGVMFKKQLWSPKMKV